MKSILLRRLIFTLFVAFLFNCDNKNESKKEIKKNKLSVQLKYSKLFDYQIINNEKILIIKSPYQNTDSNFEYKITTSIIDNNSDRIIKVPVKKIIATSTTHIPMIELLGEISSLIGFSHTQYVSSEKTRKLIDNGSILEVGKEGTLNTEIILDLAPELIVGYAVNSVNKEYSIIEKARIPVVLNADWLEETPLGRAEWIKFFGVLFDKTAKADSIFNHIEANYLAAKKIALNAKKQPTILSGAVMSKDIWNLPAGESFVATFLKDANLNYLWKDSKGKGSLSLSFESVFEKAKNAQYWIAPGYFSSKEQMLNNNKHYAEFIAFKNDKIYTPTTKQGATGGVLYYELAPTRPDLVLKDIIKITNPDLLPDYTLTFFEKMQ